MVIVGWILRAALYLAIGYGVYIYLEGILVGFFMGIRAAFTKEIDIFAYRTLTPNEKYKLIPKKIKLYLRPSTIKTIVSVAFWPVVELVRIPLGIYYALKGPFNIEGENDDDRQVDV